MKNEHFVQNAIIKIRKGVIKISNWNLGSVSANVLLLVEGVPSTISGTPLNDMAERQMQYVETFTGKTIGNTSIGLKFQSVILNLTCAEVLGFMSIQGADASSISLGDFSIGKGAGGNIETSRTFFLEKARRELNDLGRKINSYQTYYG